MQCSNTNTLNKKIVKRSEFLKKIEFCVKLFGEASLHKKGQTSVQVKLIFIIFECLISSIFFHKYHFSNCDVVVFIAPTFLVV
jgi:hypothetical protein